MHAIDLMPMHKPTVGFSTLADSTAAAKEAATAAMRDIGSEKPSWGLLFVAGKHNRERVIPAIREICGAIPIVGGSGVGTMTGSSFGYGGFEVSLMLFPAHAGARIIACSLKQGEVHAGKHLARTLNGLSAAGATVLLFYDTLMASPPPQLYVADKILEGLYSELEDRTLTIVGAGLVADMQLADSFIFDGSRPVKHELVAVVLPTPLASRTAIMHGCEPISAFMEVTRVEGPVVYELDHRPALDVILEAIGQEKTDEHIRGLSTVITLGERFGDMFADYDEAEYVNRLIVTGNPVDGSVVIFEADFQVGSKVQIMSRSNPLMIDSARKGAGKLLKETEGEKPLFGLYINCTGRAASFCGAEEEDVPLVQEAMKGIPLIGFYSGVEIAPFMGRSRPLDWTGVLTVFSGT
jgi:hypothetical protein